MNTINDGQIMPHLFFPNENLPVYVHFYELAAIDGQIIPLEKVPLLQSITKTMSESY